MTGARLDCMQVVSFQLYHAQDICWRAAHGTSPQKMQAVLQIASSQISSKWCLSGAHPRKSWV